MKGYGIKADDLVHLMMDKQNGDAEDENSESSGDERHPSQVAKMSASAALKPTSGASSENTKGALTRIILWFTDDLRLHDNYVVNWAMLFEEKKEILPVFCFDPRIYDEKQSQTKWTTRRTGRARAKFMLETVACLRNNLKAIGS